MFVTLKKDYLGHRAGAMLDIGGGFSGIGYAVNWYNTGQGSAWGMISAMAGGAVGGAITGGIMGGIGGGLARNTTASNLGLFVTHTVTGGVAGYLGGGAQSIVTQLLGTGRVDWSQVNQAANSGGMVGLAMGAAGGGLAVLGRARPMTFGGGGGILQTNTGPHLGGGLVLSFAGAGAVAVAGAPAITIAGTNVLMMTRMNPQEAAEHGLGERDPQWPWRGEHEIELHHPLMRGKTWREYWRERGFSPEEVRRFTEPLDRDIHRAIEETGWWREQLLGRIAARENELNRTLNRAEVLEIVRRLLAEVRAWSP
ncbi:MAG: hypothetical protein FJ303_19770 [Planctomycetes bacterium]|nr:hypothetical protein [Planctomycetota bacterium]